VNLAQNLNVQLYSICCFANYVRQFFVSFGPEYHPKPIPNLSLFHPHFKEMIEKCQLELKLLLAWNWIAIRKMGRVHLEHWGVKEDLGRNCEIVNLEARVKRNS
jgi:hypothetical protein